MALWSKRYPTLPGLWGLLLCVLIWAWNSRWWKKCSAPTMPKQPAVIFILIFLPWLLFPPTKGPAPWKNVAFPSRLKYSPNPIIANRAGHEMWPCEPSHLKVIYTPGRQSGFRDNTLYAFNSSFTQHKFDHTWGRSNDSLWTQIMRCYMSLTAHNSTHATSSTYYASAGKAKIGKAIATRAS